MTTQPQPEALAAGLEAFADHLPTYGFNVQTPLLAAAELRRLHAECETLRQANAAFAARQAWWNDRMVALEAECEALRMERDALRAATGGRMGYFDDEVGKLHAECEALRATQSDTLLRLLCDLRFALGDNGARMQHDLVEYARGLRADAERWRCFRTFVAGKSTRGFLNGKPAAYMVLPAITVERVGMTLDESIDAARAAKEQSNG